MIAIVCARVELAAKLAGILGSERQTVDGPCRVWHVRGPRGDPWRLYGAAENADALYAAGRLAARRGARCLFLLTAVQAAGEFLEDSGIELDEILTPARIQDVSLLNCFQSLCPDSVRKLPQPFPDKCPGESITTLADGPEVSLIVGSLAFPLTVPLLARNSWQQWRVGLFDLGGIGLARAARDAKCGFAAFCFLDKAIAPACEPEESSRIRHQRLDRILRHLVTHFADEETMTTS